MQFKKGFTLIEITIVVAILGILSSITFVTFSNVYKTHSLDKTRLTAVSLLEYSRSNSMASRQSLQYGVHFASTTITIFSGSSYSSGSASNTVFSVSPYVVLDTMSLNGGGNEVIFGRLTGTTSDYGTITYRLSTEASSTKTITIYPTGIIE